MIRLPAPPDDPAGVEDWVRSHLGDLAGDEVRRSPRFRGTQAAADAALAAFDVTGYAARRNEVQPESRRGASALSPWIRHGHLPLPLVWDHVGGGPSRDVGKFRDELLWQEYARHLYARLGTRTARSLRQQPPSGGPGGWDRSMACMASCLDELEGDGWLVNQTRMWLASHWTVREGGRWQDGEDEFFRHLLDGSRAANRLGWQWTTGAGSSKHYGFSRWQVQKRAPSLCRSCELRDDCPIEDWPDDPEFVAVERPSRLTRDEDPSTTAGPGAVERIEEPDVVWLTAESLGDDDPALSAHPELPVVFVFDEPLLSSLALSGKRLCFLAERLGELAAQRPVEVHRGRPVEVLAGRRAAVTFAPVPGFRRRVEELASVELHPWPWLRRPHGRAAASFTAWRKALGRAAR
ncbi:MAG: FAD-binding domain-containing protein [Actinomycetota bacterium]